MGSIYFDTDGFKKYIYDTFSVPGDNCTLAPNMLDGIIKYAAELFHYDREQEFFDFLQMVLPSVERHEIEKFM